MWLGIFKKILQVLRTVVMTPARLKGRTIDQNMLNSELTITLIANWGVFALQEVRVGQVGVTKP
jgi:hypothetical protein